MILVLILIAIGVVLYLVIHSNSVGVAEVDSWIESELEAMEAVDRLLEASEQARREMRRVTGTPGRSGWSPIGDETA